MKLIFALLFLASTLFAQSNQVWKYEDQFGNKRDGWNESGKYFEWTTTGADSIISAPFFTEEGWNGLLMISAQVDTVSGTDSISFKLHLHDGIDWVEYNGKLNFWLSTDSSSTTYYFDDGTDRKRYYWTSYKSSEDKGLEALPVGAFRVEMFAESAGTWRIKMAWDEY